MKAKDKIILIKSEVMDSAWDEMRETFESVEDAIGGLIKRFEEEKGEEVLSLVLAGSVGRWDGTSIGGKEAKAGEVLESSNYDDLEVYFNTEGELELKFMHHDGSHYMNLYPLTLTRLNKLGLDEDQDTWNYNEYAKVYESLTPLKDDGEFDCGWELYDR